MLEACKAHSLLLCAFPDNRQVKANKYSTKTKFENSDRISEEKLS